MPVKNVACVLDGHSRKNYGRVECLDLGVIHDTECLGPPQKVNEDRAFALTNDRSWTRDRFGWQIPGMSIGRPGDGFPSRPTGTGWIAVRSVSFSGHSRSTVLAGIEAG